MTLPEVLRHKSEGRDLLADLKGLCDSLDSWEIVVDVTSDQGRRVRVDATGYALDAQPLDDTFACPECEAYTFDVLEGVLAGRPVLGLACRQCESYGVVTAQGSVTGAGFICRNRSNCR